LSDQEHIPDNPIKEEDSALAPKHQSNASPEITKRTGTFAALSVRNFRIYAIGQLISISGTWVQSVAQAWLVLTLTHSGFALGITLALQYIPLLIAGPLGGLVADRHDRRHILILTQASSAALALGLATATLTHHVSLSIVLMFAALLGIVNLFDVPARQSFVQEMVGLELLPNAVSLNAVLMNAGRVIGPAIGGLLIAAFGVATCFYINAASFAAVLIALLLMRPSELLHMKSATKRTGQLRRGLSYAWKDPIVRPALLAVAVVGVFAFNFSTTLPLLSHITFNGSALAVGTTLSAMGVGAVLGGLIIARRAAPTMRLMSGICFAFAAFIAAVAVSPTQLVADLLLVPMGACAIGFIATANALIQLNTSEQMRGRVMALYAIGFLGSTPIGAPIVGAISTISPRLGLGIGAAATLAAAIYIRAQHARPKDTANT